MSSTERVKILVAHVFVEILLVQFLRIIFELDIGLPSGGIK